MTQTYSESSFLIFVCAFRCQAWIEEERLYIQTELCETSLEKQLESGHRLEISGVYAFLRQTLLGLEILHQHKLVHLDIKVRIRPT